jgi:hypothetical protein
MIRRLATAVLLCTAACSSAPAEPVGSVKNIPGHDSLPEDTTVKEAPRMMTSEAYVRSYLQLFGGLAPLSAIEAQNAAKGKDGSQLFDTWNDYLLALGFPDYRVDIPRQTTPNAVMVASFERVGIALCDRALEHDWLASPATPADQRLIFAFDEPGDTLDQATFEAGFDVLHRTFLGYPAKLAPVDRVSRFYTLYQSTVAAHTKATRFNASQAGWAAMCYGLVRHPEFHLY